MRSIKLYATGSSSNNNVANVTIPTATRILGVAVDAYFNAVTDDAGATLEISQASANEIAVNGAQQSIIEIRSYTNLLTSGIGVNMVNIFFPVDVSVKQGQIIYFHANVVGTCTYTFTGLLWLRD